MCAESIKFLFYRLKKCFQKSFVQNSDFSTSSHLFSIPKTYIINNFDLVSNSKTYTLKITISWFFGCGVTNIPLDLAEEKIGMKRTVWFHKMSFCYQFGLCWILPFLLSTMYTVCPRSNETGLKKKYKAFIILIFYSCLFKIVSFWVQRWKRSTNFSKHFLYSSAGMAFSMAVEVFWTEMETISFHSFSPISVWGIARSRTEANQVNTVDDQ